MSVLKADLLQNRLGTSHPQVMKADFVKAWVSIVGSTTPAYVYEGFNIAGLADNGVGQYVPSFTAVFANQTYASPINCSTNGTSYIVANQNWHASSLPGSRGIFCVISNTVAVVDPHAVYGSYLGTLA